MPVLKLDSTPDLHPSRLQELFKILTYGIHYTFQGNVSLSQEISSYIDEKMREVLHINDISGFQPVVARQFSEVSCWSV